MASASVESRLKMLAAGDLLGRWVVSACVSPGVPRLYTAHREDDEGLGVLVTTLPREARYVDRLRREAAVLRAMGHPAVPELVDFGTSREHDVVWMATRDFPGETLQDRLLSGPMPWKDACAVFQSVAQGLRHAHEHQIVHRDVHPAKILLGADGAACVVGFESARNEADLEAAVDVPLGPVGYLAPEVITEGRNAGPRADLYALGVVFYEALTGRPAFPAALMDERVDPRERMLEWKARSKPLRPSDVPDWLANLVEKATHPDPAQRLPDMDAFVMWLEAARGFWEPEAREEAPSAVEVDAPPPMVLAVRPSLAPPRVEPVATAVIDPRPWLPLAYGAAATLGVTLGVLVSVLVILVVDLPVAG